MSFQRNVYKGLSQVVVASLSTKAMTREKMFELAKSFGSDSACAKAIAETVETITSEAEFGYSLLVANEQYASSGIDLPVMGSSPPRYSCSISIENRFTPAGQLPNLNVCKTDRECPEILQAKLKSPEAIKWSTGGNIYSCSRGG